MSTETFDGPLMSISRQTVFVKGEERCQQPFKQ